MHRASQLYQGHQERDKFLKMKKKIRLMKQSDLGGLSLPDSVFLGHKTVGQAPKVPRLSQSWDSGRFFYELMIRSA